MHRFISYFIEPEVYYNGQEGAPKKVGVRRVGIHEGKFGMRVQGQVKEPLREIFEFYLFKLINKFPIIFTLINFWVGFPFGADVSERAQNLRNDKKMSGLQDLRG